MQYPSHHSECAKNEEQEGRQKADEGLSKVPPDSITQFDKTRLACAPVNMCRNHKWRICINGETYVEDATLIDSNLLAGFKYSYQPRRLPLLLLEPESPPLAASNPPRSAGPVFPPPLGSSRLLLELSLPISLIWKSNGSSSGS